MADIITLPAARRHLRLEDDYPPEQLQVYISAACLAAQGFLNRRIYPSIEEQAAAIATVPADLVAAIAARDLALVAAALVTDRESRWAARADAEQALRDARAAAVEIRRSVVADDAIRAAILLTMGDLFAHREDSVQGQVATLPNGCRALLQPYRIGLGV